MMKNQYTFDETIGIEIGSIINSWRTISQNNTYKKPSAEKATPLSALDTIKK